MSEPRADRWRLGVRVAGRVQGVYYRASAREVARRLGLVGWVRNLPTGEVELCAEGTRAALEELLQWCADGPPAAVVRGVAPRWEAIDDLEFAAFEVRR
ncbi:MAG: acylphosphatase [Myxococcales bacterium]|nr:acylphosphatase [Myxococcales bacterium]